MPPVSWSSPPRPLRVSSPPVPTSVSAPAVPSLDSHRSVLSHLWRRSAWWPRGPVEPSSVQDPVAPAPGVPPGARPQSGSRWDRADAPDRLRRASSFPRPAQSARFTCRDDFSGRRMLFQLFRRAHCKRPQRSHPQRLDHRTVRQAHYHSSTVGLLPATGLGANTDAKTFQRGRPGSLRSAARRTRSAAQSVKAAAPRLARAWWPAASEGSTDRMSYP